MGKKTTYYCDVCSSPNVNEIKKSNIQVIFSTEQTEGRAVNPYLNNEIMDICDNCMNHITKGNYLFAHGAMGHNTYYFKESK